MKVENRTAIQYVDSVDIRFSDLDFYGHVNSKHYIDLVATARLNFMEREMKHSIADVAAKGVGFFLTKSTINYRRPIVGLQKVLVSSFVEEIRDDRVLVIPFKISRADDQKLFSDGILEFTLIDMSTMRGTVANDFVVDLLFAPA